MRALIALCLFFTAGVLAAEPPDALETARRLAAAGASRLALDHVTRAQPPDTAAPTWSEWEALRVELLGRLGRHEDLLARAGAWPRSLAPAPSRAMHSAALRAAMALGNGAATRRHAVRLAWQHEVGDEELRQLRLAVIQSYLGEGRGEDAFLSMLRFEQDYRPLDRAVAARFVEGLIGLGMARQAVNWLAVLENGGALKLRLRFEAGLIDSAAALAQARALVRGNGATDAWQVLAATALKHNDRALHVEALERVLQAMSAGRGEQERAAELWQAYDTLARDTANRNQLLTGDYASWGDFAARRLEERPALARAMFGLLARNARTPDIRHNAQYRLAVSLRAGKLDRAALRLFDAAGLDAGALDAQTRYVLGEIADSAGEPGAALRYWHDLPVPAQAAAGEWALRVAATALRAGRPELAAQALKRALAGKPALAPELLPRAAGTVQDLLAAGRRNDAESLFEALLPHTTAVLRRQTLFNLARVNDAGGQWPAAADYYLRSALLADAKSPDALALQARLAGAFALARAGYRSDARAQFEWLIDNAKDPVQIDIAKRELARLKR